MIHGVPRVTILLPTQNRADVLGYAIQSALWQTEKDFELLIVGDGCTDNTQDVIGAFPDSRIRWFDLPKAPLSGYANRNFALRQARGRYVAYAQHDDILFPDHVERLIATIASTGADWAYSRPLWVMPDGVIIPFSINLTNRDELAHFLNVENHVPSTCVIHTRSALERVGFWPEDVPRIADWYCWQRIITTSANGAVGYCRVPTALHFRANWRDGDSPLERPLRNIAKSTWWPTILRQPPAAGPEQATVWRAIQTGGVPWFAELRRATDTVIDRIAWMAESELYLRIDGALAAHAKAEAAAEMARAESEALRAAQAKAEAAAQTARTEIEALRGSTSWRVTAPLRRIARRLRGGLPRTNVFRKVNRNVRLFLGDIPAFIILLESDPQRRFHVHRNLLPKLPISHIINATKATKGEIDEFLYKEKIFIDNNYTRATLTKLACSISHVRAWKAIVAQDLRHAIVFEDDVAIRHGFNLFIRRIKSRLPERFDLVHLYVHDNRNEWLRHVENTNKDYVSYIPTWGRSAYLLSRSGAEKLLAGFRTITQHGDRQISAMARRGELLVYCSSESYVDNLGQLTPLYNGEMFRSNIWPKTKE